MADELRRLPCVSVPTGGDCLSERFCWSLNRGCLAQWLDVPGNFELYKARQGSVAGRNQQQ